VRDHITKYYKNLFSDETFNISNINQVKKLQSQLMLMPDQIDNIFMTGTMHNDYTASGVTVNDKNKNNVIKADVTNKSSVEAFLTQSGLNDQEMKAGAAQLV